MPDLKPVTREGVTIPANHSFAAVNEFVHGDVHFEELQWAMLGLATDRERIVDELRALANLVVLYTDGEALPTKQELRERALSALANVAVSKPSQ